jgi:hypothetical protein
MTGRAWLIIGGLVAVLVLLLGVPIAVVAVQAQGSSTEDTTVVRISGRPGVHYAGTISSQSDGRRDISGTLGDAPDEYPTRSSESGQVVTSVNKDPNDKGMLRVDLYVNGDVVDSVSDDSGVAPLTVYFAGGAH